MGKPTISIAMFNSYVKLPEGIFPYCKMGLIKWDMNIKKKYDMKWVLAIMGIVIYIHTYMGTSPMGMAGWGFPNIA